MRIGNVLVVGSGAREHALAWKLGQGARVDRVFCAPGNAGTEAVAESVPLGVSQIDAIANWCVANQIGLVVVGPEEPLARGLADLLQARNVPVFGPSAAGARIESSKSWAKDLMRRSGVPTADYATFTDPAAARAYVRAGSFPVVLKADGLAAGKGVVVAQTPDEASNAIHAALADRIFGDAGRILLAEEFLVGEELSLFAVVDGRTVVPMLPARDHKRVGEGETGPNTGGMGAYAPSHLADDLGIERLSALVVEPIANALADLGIRYQGILYAGLILTAAGPKVIEFNCRFGDPETQVVLPLLETDLAEVAFATATGQLPQAPLRFGAGYQCGIVLTAEGYPGPYSTGQRIDGISDVDQDTLIFDGGTARAGDQLVTGGGRVLTVVGTGSTLAEARSHAYENARRIHFEGVQYRRDIGLREA